MTDLGPIFRSLLRSRLGAALIALQIALTLAIVTNATHIIAQRNADMARPSGLDEANTAIFLSSVFDQNIDVQQLYRDDLEALRGLDGVIAVTTSQSIPVSGSGWGSSIYVTAETPSNETVNFGNFMVEPQALEAFDLALVAGRNFTQQDMVFNNMDTREPARVTLVSQAMADEMFPDGDALGKTVFNEPNGVQPLEIIGIYDHMQNAWPSSTNVNNTALMPVIANFGGDMQYVVRTEPGMRDSVMRQGEEYLARNRGRMVERIRSFEEQKKRTYSDDYAMVRLLTAVMVLLTVVTGLGIIGLAWFSVAQRRKQIGTRRALGASRGHILRYFMLENGLITATGLGLGLLLTLGLNWFLDTQFSIGRIPWWYLPAGMAFLAALGQLAVLLPARAAAAIPPALATRSV